MAQINQFQIISNGVQLDSYDNLDFSFTYQIDDIRDITQKKSSYSKTIVLPGTDKNKEYFKQLQDVNIDIGDSTYNPKKSLPVQVKIDDELIFQGNLQLLSVINNQFSTDFEVVVTGVFKNIIINMADYYLDQLDLSEYDHIRKVSTIVNSYDNLIYVNNTLTQVEPGTGYIYPMIINGTSQIQLSNLGINLSAIDLNPAIYLKTLIDKLFQFAGYTYESNFFNSSYFKSLIMPLEAPQYPSTDVQTRTVRVGINPIQNYSYPNSPMMPQPNSIYTINGALALGGLPGYVPISPAMAKNNSWWSNATSGKWWMNFNRETGAQGNIVFQDSYNQWSTNSQLQNICSYTNQEAGYYSINFNMDFNGFYVHKTNASFKWLSGSLKYVSRIYKVGVNGALTLLVQSNPSTGSSFSPSGTGTLPSPYLDPITQTMTLSVTNVWLNAGEQIRVNVQFQYPTSVSWQSVSDNVYFQALASGSNPINYLEIKPATTTNYSVNTPLPITKMLPKLKMRELFLDVVKMFNLFVYEDPNDSSNLIIEPRDDFFSSKPRIKDWTYMLDHNQDIKLTPMSELDVKSYYFTYKEDSDFYNVKYTQQTEKTYGEFQYDFINDFSTQEKKLELNISPTPITDNFINKSKLVAPFFCNIDDNSQLSPVKVKPRILFSKKLSNAPRPYFLRNTPTDSGSQVNLSRYVYCGMYDDPFDPTYSLEFGDSNVLYYNTSLCCPGSNLVNQFYLNTLSDLSDVNAKLMEAYFHLTPSDINDFDFRDIILIDNSYWRVNTIEDYNPNAIDRLTKVILYKLSDLKNVFNDNLPVTTSEVDCPDDMIAKLTKYGTYIYVSASNQPITQACCESMGGVWSNGACKAVFNPTTPTGNGGIVNTTSGNVLPAKILPQVQVKSGSIYTERPESLLKNQNVNNSNTTIIAGSNNYVDYGSTNNIIVGNDNSINSSTTNSIVVGDGITNAPSNSIVVGDLLLNTDGVRWLNPYKIDGCEDEVMQVNKTNYIDVVDGTIDSVRNFGGDSKLRPIIDGSEPPTI